MNILEKDSVKCYMIQNSQDTRFWIQYAADGYNVCPDLTCTTTNTDWNDDATPSNADWIIPTVDEEPLSPFCTTTSSSFACTSIMCKQDRKFDTGYTDDVIITATGTPALTDTLTVPSGAAQYGINAKDETGTAAAAGASYIASDVELTMSIVNSASSLTLATLSAAILASLSLF